MSGNGAGVSHDVGLTIERASGVTEMPRGMRTGVGYRGRFHVECWSPNGELKWTEDCHNDSTAEGLKHCLDVTFGGGTAIDPWYIGLINGTSATLAFGDTAASHPWTENTSYTGNRKEWSDDAATSDSSTASKTNSTTANFTMSGSGDVFGLFVIDDDGTGSDTTLWATAAFSSSQSYSASDVLKITYTTTMQDAA